MAEAFQIELQELGLLPAEAQVYLALVRNRALSGSAIASVTGFPRSSVYLTINSLLDKGLIEGGAGQGSRFSVVPPDKALPSLVVQEKEAISQREKLAAHLGHRLLSLVEPADPIPDELIQVIRSPRAAAERFDRLQLEAEREIQGFVKNPIFITARPDNPVQTTVRRKGVRIRVIYEKAVVKDPLIKPHLAAWIAGGEEARVYDGQLPHKLQIFDKEAVLLPLIMPGDQTRTLFIRHKQLAASLSMLFEVFWERAQPLAIAEPQTPSRPSRRIKQGPTDHAGQRISRNSRRGQSAKK